MSKSRLHRVEARYTILAHGGGYAEQIQQYKRGVRSYLIVLIENPDGPDFWLRVTPDPGESVPDPFRSEVVHLFNRADAIFVNQDGNRVHELPLIEVWLNINTEVKATGMHAGTLVSSKALTPLPTPHKEHHDG